MSSRDWRVDCPSTGYSARGARFTEEMVSLLFNQRGVYEKSRFSKLTRQNTSGWKEQTCEVEAVERGGREVEGGRGISACGIRVAAWCCRQLAWFHSEELLGRIATSRRKLLIRSHTTQPRV
ncbi:hypothetical protein KVR01_001509 [Diaporthe batatas]|uniref:uncharacterized protein n=1 Tax=Diaporthe batatas TaxID=748121 RepID=UPI001D055A60|nr:uncharacterized protein KVR01_001509 [Diaporthe batatas]KAG8168760.1 hypothetical protein KVR01_001509 [Diaporthe batatas]